MFSLEILNFIYDYFLVLIDLTENINFNNSEDKDKPNEKEEENIINNNIRKDLVFNMYKEIKEKIEYSKELLKALILPNGKILFIRQTICFHMN